MTAGQLISPLIGLAKDGAVMTVPGVARYCLAADGSVVAEAEEGADDLDIACHANGPVAALSLLLQGMFPLRAAAVARNGTAVVICGRSGAGKSAAAAAAAMRGWHGLADSVVVLRPGPELVARKPLELCLWPPAAAALGLDDKTGSTVRRALAKRAYRIGAAGDAGAIERVVLVILDIDNAIVAPRLDRIESGRHKLAALLAQQWHRLLIAPLGREIDYLEWAAGVASEIDVAVLKRPRLGDSFASVADLLDALAGA